VLSEIAFDAKHQFAVLKHLLVCGQHCVSGATLVMEKAEGKWTTSSRRPCAMFSGDFTFYNYYRLRDVSSFVQFLAVQSQLPHTTVERIN